MIEQSIAPPKNIYIPTPIRQSDPRMSAINEKENILNTFFYITNNANKNNQSSTESRPHFKSNHKTSPPITVIIKTAILYKQIIP
jgi:hypothetical protein